MIFIQFGVQNYKKNLTYANILRIFFNFFVSFSLVGALCPLPLGAPSAATNLVC